MTRDHNAKGFSNELQEGQTVMTIQEIAKRNAAIDLRYAAVVGAKLGGVAVRVLRHDIDRRSGASVPVFGVPLSSVAEATRLGLRCESV